MLTAARLREDVRPEGLDWITALRAPQVKKLVRDGDLQLTLFDVQDLAEITSPDFPGERLVACMNPFLEAERARKRESLLAATEADLEKIAAACARARRPLRGQDKIALRVDRGPEPAQGRQALHHRHRRRPLQLRPQPGLHHRRGRPGRHLRAAHQRRARRPGHPARSSPPTRPWPRSSGPSAPSTPTWTSGRSGTAPRTGSARTCSCGCCRTTSPGTCRPGSRPSCSPTTTSPPPRPPGTSPVAPAARSPKALAKAATKHTDDDLPVHSFAQPARRPGHHLPEHHRARRPGPARLPARHYPDRRPAPGPRPARRQPPPRRSRSQQPRPGHHESPGKRPSTRIAGGNFGLEDRCRRWCERLYSLCQPDAWCQGSPVARGPGSTGQRQGSEGVRHRRPHRGCHPGPPGAVVQVGNEAGPRRRGAARRAILEGRTKQGGDRRRFDHGEYPRCRSRRKSAAW